MTGVSVRERAAVDFATYEVVWLGKSTDDKSATWDVTDAVTPQRVTFEIAARAYRCDCAFFAAGLGQPPCVHIEVLKLHRERQAAKAAPAPITAPDAAPGVTPPASAPATESAPDAAPSPTAPPRSLAPPAAPTTQPSDAIARLLGVLVASVGELVVAVERQAAATEALARYSAPKAPNYRRLLAEWTAFEWETIDAEVLQRDHDGVASVRWGGFVWTRRAPENKFGEAVWYSRPDGKAEDGANRYARLITFSKPTEAEPVSRKVQHAVAP
jgi:hypothetical protein